MTDNVMLSVILTVFNHENYLARALSSILEQETNFTYEIVIGDDASDDSSASVIADFAGRFPEIVVPIYRRTNIGGSRNFTDLFRRCRGQYITFIDGDDYWIDQRKLQIQYDFLEHHPDVFAVAHKVKVCDADGALINIVPRGPFKNDRITIKDFLMGNRFPLTSTMMRALRGQELDDFLDRVEIGARNAGDTTICLFLLDKGPIPILKSAMTVYRYRSTVGHGNYNSITKLHERLRDRIQLLRINDNYFGGKYCFSWLYIRLAAGATRGLIAGNASNIKALVLLIINSALLSWKTAFSYFWAKLKNISESSTPG